MQGKPFPMSDHPLTKALIAGAQAKNHQAMSQATLLARDIARDLAPVQVEQCKLAAEVLIERNQ